MDHTEAERSERGRNRSGNGRGLDERSRTGSAVHMTAGRTDFFPLNLPLEATVETLAAPQRNQPSGRAMTCAAI